MERTISVSIDHAKASGENTAAGGRAKRDMESVLGPAAGVLGVSYFMMITIPVYAIFAAAGLKNSVASLAEAENAAALGISLQTTALTVFFIFLFCTPVVFYLSGRKESMLAKVLDILVRMPAVLPPAVAGIGLLLAFGRAGLVGSFLERAGIGVVFTPAAVILAQFFVSSGLYIQVLKTGVDAVEPEIFEVSYLFGLGRAGTFLKVIVPMQAKPLAAGLMLSWTRAMGEFGATLMFAGNMAGKTRTVPLQIYTLLQTDIDSAASVSMLLFIISFAVLFLLKILIRE